MRKMLHFLFTFVALCFSLHAETLFAIVYDDSVVIWNTNVHTNCGSLYVFDIAQSQDSIIIVERDTSMLIASCMCNFDLSVTLKGLDKGHYFVIVYRKLSPAYHSAESLFVGATEFTIGKSSLIYSLQSYQSSCGGSGQGVVIENESSGDFTFTLLQNYPNPFNPATTINYKLPITSYVTLKVFDLLGREVATLVNEEMQIGEHSVQWNASGMPGGVYFYRLATNGFLETKKMILLR
jgi:hypothetical protein